jgi:hypothetical protein
MDFFTVGATGQRSRRCIFLKRLHPAYRDHPIVSDRRAPLGNDDWFEALLVFYVLPLVQTDISEVIIKNKLHLGEV